MRPLSESQAAFLVQELGDGRELPDVYEELPTQPAPLGPKFEFLTGASLEAALLLGADLTNAFFPEVKLRSADLFEANLRRANAGGGDFSGANLRAADLRDAKAEEADFTGADLRRADLSCARLSGADLTDARLEGAILATRLGRFEWRVCDLSHAVGLTDLQLAQTKGWKQARRHARRREEVERECWYPPNQTVETLALWCPTILLGVATALLWLLRHQELPHPDVFVRVFQVSVPPSDLSFFAAAAVILGLWLSCVALFFASVVSVFKVAHLLPDWTETTMAVCVLVLPIAALLALFAALRHAYAWYQTSIAPLLPFGAHDDPDLTAVSFVLAVTSLGVLLSGAGYATSRSSGRLRRALKTAAGFGSAPIP